MADKCHEIVERLAENIRTKEEISLQEIKGEMNQMQHLPDCRDQYPQLRNYIREVLQQRYDEQLQAFRHAIFQNTIRDERTFGQWRQRLMNLSVLEIEESQIELHGRRDEFNRLRNVWKNRQAIEKVSAQVERKIEQYEKAILNGGDFEAAQKDYLDSANEDIDQAMQRYDLGDEPEIQNLIRSIRQKTQGADKTQLITKVVTGKFREIIDELREQPEDYEQDIIGLDGIPIGRKRRDEAILAYQKLAINFARQKGQGKIKDAERKIKAGTPMLADDLLVEAENLYMVPETIKQQVAQVREKHNLEEKLKRVEDGRRQLRLVLTARSLDDAITIFRNALDETRGWPGLQTIHEQEVASKVNQADYSPDDYEAALALHADQVPDDYADALAHIAESIKHEIERYSDSLQDDTWIPNIVDKAKLNQLQAYIDFANSYRANLAPGLQQVVHNLRTRFVTQDRQRQKLEHAYTRAKQYEENKEYEEMYTALRDNAEILETHTDIFPTEASAWANANAIRNAKTLYHQLQTLTDRAQMLVAEAVESLEQGRRLRENAYETPLKEFQQAIQDANGIKTQVRTIDGEVAKWDMRISRAKQAGSFLRAVDCISRDDLQSAREAVESSGDPNNTVTHSLLEIIEARNQDDEGLAQLLTNLPQQPRHLDVFQTEYLRDLYQEFKEYEGKRNVRHYDKWLDEFPNIRRLYAAALRRDILANIQDERSQDPTILSKLEREYEEVDSEQWEGMSGEIDRAKRLQLARQMEAQAWATTHIEKLKNNWRNAYIAWENSDNQVPIDVCNQYFRAIAQDGLWQSEERAQNSDEAHRIVVTTIRQLQQFGNTEATIDADITEPEYFILKVREAEVVSSHHPDIPLRIEEITRENHCSTDYDTYTTYRGQQTVRDFRRRMQTVVTVARSAKALSQKLTIDNRQSILDWCPQIATWHQHTTNEEVRSLGVVEWLDKKLSALEDEMRDAISVDDMPPWEVVQLEARLACMGNQLSQIGIRDRGERLILEAERLIADTQGNLFAEIQEQETICRAMAEGFRCLVYVTTNRLMHRPINDLQGNDDLLLHKVGKIWQDCEANAELLRNLHDLLSALRTRTLNPIGRDTYTELQTTFDENFRHENAPYHEYTSHPKVSEIYQEFRKSHSQFESYAQLESNMQAAITNNQFEQLETLIASYDAHQARKVVGQLPFPRVTLPNQRQLIGIHNITEYKDRVLGQLRDMRRYIEDNDVFSSQTLMTELRDKLANPAPHPTPSLTFEHMTIAQTKDVQNDIDNYANEGKYFKAVNLLQAILSGTPQELRKHQLGTRRSLHESRNLLLEFSNQFPDGSAESPLATELQKWCHAMLEATEDEIEAVEKCSAVATRKRDKIQRLKREFDERFDDWVKKRGAFIRLGNAPSHHKLEDEMQIIFHHMTGRGYPDNRFPNNLDPNNADPDYPLAPAFRACDERFEQVKRSIQERSR